MENHYEIREDGVTYSLGRRRGEQIIYDFPKILDYLQVKGKKLFGGHFKIYEEDRDLLYSLSNYFIRDLENCEKLKLDLGKGILLSGPVGCGKTSLLRLFKFIAPAQRPYEVVSSRNITFGFNHLGFKTVLDFGDSGYYCFDDLGLEPLGKFFGQECEVMGEIILSRHELFQKHKLKTHATTNLNANELEERYGERVRSRMRQMFNQVSFQKDAKDKRK